MIGATYQAGAESMMPCRWLKQGLPGHRLAQLRYGRDAVTHTSRRDAGLLTVGRGCRALPIRAAIDRVKVPVIGYNRRRSLSILTSTRNS